MSELPRILLGGLAPLAIAYSLGALCFGTLALPRVVLLAAGTAIESTLLFLLLLAGRATPSVFAAFAILAMAPLLWLRPRRPADPPARPLNRSWRVLFIAIFAAYGVLYLVEALAPEVEFDGFTYHLGLPAEYARLGGFPDRVGFFEMLPHGMEMLFTLAFAIGRHPAAKLCHFAYLAATPPLLLAIARRLGLAATAGWAAAAFYVCAPVVGLAGTSVHNDAPLVLFTLTAGYLLLRWRQEGDSRYLWPAGLVAGFCYATKLPGLLVPALGVGLVLLQGRWKPVLAVAAPAAAAIAPWMLRAAVLTGNPFAPLLNRWFPNPWFHISAEQDLVRRFSGFSGFTYWNAPLELALGGRLEGIFGPLLLFTPLALLSLRYRSGRWILAAAGLLSAPWFLNHGARFLMPAMSLGWLALALALPRPGLWAAVAFHAVASWPQVIPFYAQPGTWQFKEFPWRAALRLEPEDNYLRRVMPEYRVAELLNQTPPGSRTFCLTGTPRAYTDRPFLEFWHSAEADRLMDALRAGGMNREPLFNLRAEWPEQDLRALRFRLPQGRPAEWCIHEVELYDGERRLPASRGWTLDAWPNPWETPAALDGNRATRWRTWEPMRRGMYFEVNFNRPTAVTGALLVSPTPIYHVPVEFHGLGRDGRWHLLSVESSGQQRVQEDLRRPAIRALRRAGFRYILAPDGPDDAGPLGAAMAGHLFEWRLSEVASREGLRLFRIP